MSRAQLASVTLYKWTLLATRGSRFYAGDDVEFSVERLDRIQFTEIAADLEAAKASLSRKLALVFPGKSWALAFVMKGRL